MAKTAKYTDDWLILSANYLMNKRSKRKNRRQRLQWFKYQDRMMSNLLSLSTLALRQVLTCSKGEKIVTR